MGAALPTPSSAAQLLCARLWLRGHTRTAPERARRLPWAWSPPSAPSRACGSSSVSASTMTFVVAHFGLSPYLSALKKMQAFTWRMFEGTRCPRRRHVPTSSTSTTDVCGCCSGARAVRGGSRASPWPRKIRGRTRGGRCRCAVIDHLHWIEEEEAPKGGTFASEGFEQVFECLAELRCPLVLVGDARDDWLGFARRVIAPCTERAVPSVRLDESTPGK